MKSSLKVCFCFLLAFGLTQVVVAQPTFDLGWSVDDSVEAEAGAEVALTAIATLSPGGDHGDSGAQGWSLSFTADGWSITAVSTEGTTSADEADGGLVNTGFVVTETTSDAAAGSDCEGLAGGVAAVVLSFIMPITLPTDADSDIAAVSLSGSAPEISGNDN